MDDNITIDDLLKIEDCYYRFDPKSRDTHMNEILKIGKRFNLSEHDLRYIGVSFHRGLRHIIQVLAQYGLSLELKVEETEEVNDKDIQAKIIHYLRKKDMDTFIWLTRHASFDELKKYLGHTITDIEVYRWIIQYGDYRYLYLMTHNGINRGLNNKSVKTTLASLISSETTIVLTDVYNALKEVEPQTDYPRDHVIPNLYQLTYIRWMKGSLQLHSKRQKCLFETGFRRDDFYFSQQGMLLEESDLVYIEDMMVNYFKYNQYGIQLLLNASPQIKNKYTHLHRIIDTHYNYLKGKGLIEEDYLTQEVGALHTNLFSRYLSDLSTEFKNMV